MSRLEAIIRAAGRSSRQVRDPYLSWYTAGTAVQPPYAPDLLLLLADECPVHSACINVVVQDAVLRGWYVEDGDEDVWRTALEEVTPEATWLEVLAAVARDMLTVGWGALEVARQGQTLSVYYLPAHTLRVTRDGGYMQERGGRTVTWAPFGSAQGDQGEVIYFRQVNPRSPWYGIPHWVSAIPAIQELTAIRNYNIRWYTSAATTDRLIICRGAHAGEAESLAERVRDGLVDARARGHTQIILPVSADGDVQVQFLSQREGQHEGQFAARREDLVREVLMAHSVPPYRIGWAELGSLGGSTAEEMLEAYRTGVVEPLQTVLEDTLARTLFGPQGLRLRGIFRLRDLTTVQLESRAKTVATLIEHAVITPAEARVMLGLSDADEAAAGQTDRFYAASNLRPLGEETAGGLLKELEEALEAEIREQHVQPQESS